MTDNTVIGNICQDPTFRQTRRGDRPIARFTVAVNRWRRAGEELVQCPPVFHRVVCYGALAENVNNSLRKGMEVLVVGQWVDESYSDEKGHRHPLVSLEAKTIGAGLRWATATVTRTERPPAGLAAAGSAVPVSSADSSPPGGEPALARAG
jgi:single-strand DNA-binding protein